ncbi:MAG: hypothetical protein U0168_32350 [Nannocystaceae bacterium]
MAGVAVDCVVGQAAAQGAFWASWPPRTAPAASASPAPWATYAAAYFDIIAGGDTIQYGCSGFAATPDCSVAPFAPCATCLDMDEGHTACLGRDRDAPRVAPVTVARASLA